MNPWNTLNIEPTDDKKSIKKAYAILIKKYKPDEQPEKFKEIQAAYKMALSMSQWQNEESEETEETEDSDTDTLEDVIESEGFKLSENTLDEIQLNKEEQAIEQQQQALIENLYKQLHEIAFAPLAVKDKLENWKFIEDFYQIDDFTLKAEVAKTVFKKVAEYNLFQMKQNNTLLIKPVILKYLDEVFDWSSHWNEYQHIFPDHYFSYAESAENERTGFQVYLDKIGYILNRFWAFIIDFFIIGLLYSFLPKTETSLFIVSLVIIRLVFELITKFHSTLGKLFANLIVVDAFGNTCSKTRIILRHIIFNMTFVPIFYFPMAKLNYLVVFIGIIALLNIITIIKWKLLFHDSISGTTVVQK